MFQFIAVVWRKASSECNPQGAKNLEVGCQIGTARTNFSFCLTENLESLVWLSYCLHLLLWIVVALFFQEFHQQDFFSVPENTTHAFTCRIFSSSLSLMLPFNTHWLAFSGPHERCTPRTSFFGWRRAATKSAWRSAMLQQTALSSRYTALHVKLGEMCC